MTTRVRGGFAPPTPFLVPDAELGYVVSPRHASQRTTGDRRFDIYTNALGAREAATDAETRDTIDLLAVGGEHTFGMGVDHKVTFVARVAERAGWTAGNFAVPLQNGVAALLMMRRMMRLRPKVVIYGFFAADVIRNISACVAGNDWIQRQVPIVMPDGASIQFPATPHLDDRIFRRWDIEKPYLEKSNSWAFKAKWRLFRQLHERRAAFYAIGPMDGPHYTWMIQSAHFVLSRMDETAASAGATAVLVYIPTYLDLPVMGAPDFISSFAATLPNTIFVNMAADFEQALRTHRRLDIAGALTMNERGHELIANAIVVALAERGLIPGPLAVPQRPSLSALRQRLGATLKSDQQP